MTNDIPTCNTWPLPCTVYVCLCVVACTFVAILRHSHQVWVKYLKIVIPCPQLVEILQQQYGLPKDVAVESASNFLRTFRACPDDNSFALDEWHTHLWRNCLPKNFKHISSKCSSIHTHTHINEKRRSSSSRRSRAGNRHGRHHHLPFTSYYI